MFPEPINSISRPLYGNQAISKLINQKLWPLFALATSHMMERHRKPLKRAFRMLIENDVRCVVMTDDVAVTAVNLLSSLSAFGSMKMNERNDLNDLLILSAAMTLKANLLTNDSKLKVLASVIEAPCETINQVTTIRFAEEQPKDTSRPSAESKGYLNRRLREALTASFARLE